MATEPADTGPESPIPEIDIRIHEPARLRVLVLLSMVDEADFMYVLRQTGLSRGNLSVQMVRLEEAGFVQVERGLDGRRPRTTYSLSAGGRRALREYRRTLQSLLDALPD